MDDSVFAIECAKRGLCPVCINAGADRDHDLGLGGVCLNCGYVPKFRTEEPYENQS